MIYCATVAALRIKAGNGYKVTLICTGALSSTYITT
jgi:hypothetical protein